MTSEKGSLLLQKNTTILKFQYGLDHGNDDGCLLVTRNYASPTNSRKMHLGRRKPENKTPTNPDRTTKTRANTAIKLEMTSNIEVEGNEMKHHETTYYAMEKRLLYNNKEGKEDETGRKSY